MKKIARISLFLTRLSLGGVFLYAGITKIMDPEWSAEGYINSTTILKDFYAIFSSPEYIDWVNLLNKWGLVLIGASLIIGLLVRVSGILGFILMILYYLPALTFPYAGENAFIFSEHLVYGFLLLYLGARNAGKRWGLDALLFKDKI